MTQAPLDVAYVDTPSKEGGMLSSTATSLLMAELRTHSSPVAVT